MRIIFIRHGRTESNVNHLLDTAFPGAPLDEVGLEQAATLPERLAHEPIEVVMTSDIVRAQQTAEPLARALGVPLITHPGVREIYAGDWELDEDWEGYVDVITAWNHDRTVSMPNGDDGVSFYARYDAAIAELEDYECVAVVSHGGALQAWMRGSTGTPVDDAWILRNTDTIVVEGAPGSWRIVTWADMDL